MITNITKSNKEISKQHCLLPNRSTCLRNVPVGFLHIKVTEEGHGEAYDIEGRFYYSQVPRGRGMTYSVSCWAAPDLVRRQRSKGDFIVFSGRNTKKSEQSS